MQNRNQTKEPGTEFLNGFIFLSIMITAEAAGGSDIGKPTVKPSSARLLFISLINMKIPPSGEIVMAGGLASVLRTAG